MLAESQTQQFSAVEVDQFGNNMYPNRPRFTWSAGGAAASFPTPATGDGSYPTPPPGIAITSGGLYTAPPVGDATGTVTAMADGISGLANVAAEDDVEVYVQANSGTARPGNPR